MWVEREIALEANARGRAHTRLIIIVKKWQIMKQLKIFFFFFFFLVKNQEQMPCRYQLQVILVKNKFKEKIVAKDSNSLNPTNLIFWPTYDVINRLHLTARCWRKVSWFQRIYSWWFRLYKKKKDDWNVAISSVLHLERVHPGVAGGNRVSTPF